MAQPLPAQAVNIVPLKGPITVVHSTRARTAKVHLDSTCEGLENTPEVARAERTYLSLADLLSDESTRPCRMCALAACLAAAAQTDTYPARQRELVTFSSQAAPAAFDGNVYSFDYAQTTPSGRQRLVALAEHLNWPVVSTRVGPVSAALVSRSLAGILARNLRTIPLGLWPARREVPLIAVEVLWTLTVDTPPELHEASPADLWSTALLLAR